MAQIQSNPASLENPEFGADFIPRETDKVQVAARVGSVD
jgi:hypothetical protein